MGDSFEAAIREAERHFKRALGGGLQSNDQTIMMIALQLRARVLSIAGWRAVRAFCSADQAIAR